MSANQDGIKCSHCGTINRASARVCNKCGMPLAASNKTVDLRQTAPLAAAQPAATTAPIPAAPSGPNTARLAPVSNLPPDQSPTVRLAPTGFKPLPIGAVFNDRYEVTRVAQETPDTNVYLVSDQNGEGQTRLLYESRKAAQFAREREMIDRHLTHSNLLIIHDAFDEMPYEEQVRGYMVTEYPIHPVPRPLSEIQALTVGIQATGALAYLHGEGIAHGNMSADSLAIVDNQVRLWQFGPAAPGDARANDIAMLAHTLYELTIAAGQTSPSLSPTTMQVLQRGFSPNAAERYADATAFGADLQKAIDALRRPARVNLIVGRATDVGMHRELNEDSLLTLELSQFYQTGNQVVGIFAVADGMGGAAAGEVASKVVTETLARELVKGLMLPRLVGAAEQPDYKTLITQAVLQANAAVLKVRQQMRNDMGSTLVGVLLVGAQAWVFNVGDSRAYLVGPDRMVKISKDHSLVQALVDSGQITEAEVRTHPQRNYILRNMGDKPQLDVDVFPLSLEPGQGIIVCSDGLWEMVVEDQMLQIINRAASPQDACRELIAAANANGGDDNITCVLVQVESAAGSAK